MDASDVTDLQTAKHLAKYYLHQYYKMQHRIEVLKEQSIEDQVKVETLSLKDFNDVSFDVSSHEPWWYLNDSDTIYSNRHVFDLTFEGRPAKKSNKYTWKCVNGGDVIGQLQCLILPDEAFFDYDGKQLTNLEDLCKCAIDRLMPELDKIKYHPQNPGPSDPKMVITKTFSLVKVE